MILLFCFVFSASSFIVAFCILLLYYIVLSSLPLANKDADINKLSLNTKSV